MFSPLDLFKLNRAEEVQCRVFALLLVEALDVVEDVHARIVTGAVDLAAQALCLHRAEEVLHRGVVPAVTTAAHAAGGALAT